MRYPACTQNTLGRRRTMVQRSKSMLRLSLLPEAPLKLRAGFLGGLARQLRAAERWRLGSLTVPASPLKGILLEAKSLSSVKSISWPYTKWEFEVIWDSLSIGLCYLQVHWGRESVRILAHCFSSLSFTLCISAFRPEIICHSALLQSDTGGSIYNQYNQTSCSIFISTKEQN